MAEQPTNWQELARMCKMTYVDIYIQCITDILKGYLKSSLIYKFKWCLHTVKNVKQSPAY